MGRKRKIVKKEGDRMTRKHQVRRQKAVSAVDVALAACRALLPTEARPRPDVRRATVLARFAVAMTK